MGAIIVVAVVVISVFLLKGFDRIAGRGEHQIKKGINNSNLVEKDTDRIKCPECAEKIMPTAKKCRFCGARLRKKKKIQ